MTLRTTGIAALLLSIIAGLTSTLLFAAAFQFRADQEPTRIVAAGATSAELLRWGSVLDLFGYYLPTAVLAYVLWRQLRPRNPLVADLSTTAAVSKALAGGVGAAVLAMVAPMFMHAYTDATAAGQALIRRSSRSCCRWCGVPSGNSWTPSSWQPGGWESGGSSAPMVLSLIPASVRAGSDSPFQAR